MLCGKVISFPLFPILDFLYHCQIDLSFVPVSITLYFFRGIFGTFSVIFENVAARIGSGRACDK